MSSAFERNLASSLEVYTQHDGAQSPTNTPRRQYLDVNLTDRHRPHIDVPALLIGRKLSGKDYFPNFQALASNSQSLIAAALQTDLPPPNLPFVFHVVNLEAVVAAAIIRDRTQGATANELGPRADAVQRGIYYRKDGWAGVEEVPSGFLPRTITLGLAPGLVDFVTDINIGLAERIDVTGYWLINGKHPEIDKKAQKAQDKFAETLRETKFMHAFFKSNNPRTYSDYPGCNIQEFDAAYLGSWSAPNVSAVAMEISNTGHTRYAKAVAFTRAPVAIVSVRDSEAEPAIVRGITSWNPRTDKYFDAVSLRDNLATSEWIKSQAMSKPPATWRSNHSDIEPRDEVSNLNLQDVTRIVTKSIWRFQTGNN